MWTNTFVKEVPSTLLPCVLELSFATSELVNWRFSAKEIFMVWPTWFRIQLFPCIRFKDGQNIDNHITVLSSWFYFGWLLATFFSQITWLWSRISAVKSNHIPVIIFDIPVLKWCYKFLYCSETNNLGFR